MVESYDLFISYCGDDQSWVEGFLIDALKESGVSYNIEKDFILGAPWIAQVEDAIKNSKNVLLILSNAYLQQKSKEVIEILAATYGMDSRDWPVIPLYLDKMLDLPLRLKSMHGLDATNSETEEDSLSRLIKSLKAVPKSSKPPPPSPYIGARSYQESDSDFYFGRTKEIDDSEIALMEKRLLVLTGGSGSGKSSLVNAGIIPRIKNSPNFSTVGWSCVLFDLKDYEYDSTFNHADLRSELDSKATLVVIDELERVFKTENYLSTELFSSVKEVINNRRVHVILIVRDEYYSLCREQLIIDNQDYSLVRVDPLSNKALEEVITRPAEGLDVYIEPALTERLLNDFSGQYGGLHWLQKTMNSLWLKIRRKYLPLSVYQVMSISSKEYGNRVSTLLHSVLQDSAENFFNDLNEDQKSVVIRVFLRLSNLEDEINLTNRSTNIEECLSKGDDLSNVYLVIKYLTDERLITLVSSNGYKTNNIEISHAFLLRYWERCAEWSNELRKHELLRRGLSSVAKNSLLKKREIINVESFLKSAESKRVGVGDDIYLLLSNSKSNHKKNKITLFSLSALLICAFLLLLWDLASPRVVPVNISIRSGSNINKVAIDVINYLSKSGTWHEGSKKNIINAVVSPWSYSRCLIIELDDYSHENIPIYYAVYTVNRFYPLVGQCERAGLTEQPQECDCKKKL